jgi:hypothetical protein
MAGVIAGFVIGVVASLVGVAGGELLIPTLVLLFGVDIKLAGSLSLVVRLPTMLVGFTRYSRDRSFSVLGRNRDVSRGDGRGIRRRHVYRRPPVGTGAIPNPAAGLAVILVTSAVKVWRQQSPRDRLCVPKTSNPTIVVMNSAQDGA